MSDKGANLFAKSIMIDQLKQFVPSAVCLQCDGCCRFKAADSPWRPKLGAEEAKGLAARITQAGWLDDDGHIRTLRHCGQDLCRFFDPADHTCKVYDDRPFECALYPFVLSRSDAGVEVYVHLSCPYVQDAEASAMMEEYVAYLKGYFQTPPVLDFLKRNAALVHDYSPFLMELQHLFTIEGLRL